MIPVLFIDNYDSFIYNLVDNFRLFDCKTFVFRNNIKEKELEKVVDTIQPKLIVLSPGPGNPNDSGASMTVLEKYSKSIPIFGVCLGHQCIGQYFGAKVVHAPEIIHGKASWVKHNGDELFKHIKNPLRAMRYHSLMVEDLTKELIPIAYTDDIIMAVRHKKYPVYGVQFHPESILSPEGNIIIQNILEIIT